MALTFTDVGSGNSTTAGATLDVTGVTAAIGTLLVLACAADNAGTAGVSSTSATITDAAGNTWTRRSVVNRTETGAASDGTTLSIWTCPVTSTLSSATITLNFSPDTTSKAAILQKVAAATGASVVFDSVGSGGSGNGTTISTGNVSVAFGSTIVAFSALENSSQSGSDADTTNGSWSTRSFAIANSGSAPTSQAVCSQHKTVTAAGNQSWDSTTASARDYAWNWLILYEKVNASLAATEATDIAAFVDRLSTGLVLAATGAADTASFAASAHWNLQLVATEAADAAAFNVDITIHEHLAGLEAPDVAAFAATLSVTARLAATGAGDTAAFVLHKIHPAALAVGERPDRAEVQISPYWPAALPLPTLQAYSLKPASAAVRLPMEIGAARAYRRTVRPLAEVQVTFQLDDWQQMLFDGFYRAVTLEGGQWFALTLAFPAASDPGGLALATARFKDQVAFKALGGPRWQATATLELLQRPVMSEADLTALLDDEGEDPAWPEALLPKPVQDSWTLQPKPALARSEDVPGLPRQRQRSRNSTTEAEPRWELDATEAAVFDAFFRWRGRDGAQWFAFPLYQGMGVVETKVRFLGEAEWTPRAGGRWSVTAAIEIRERQVVTAEEFAWLVGEDPEELFEAITELHVVADEIFAEEA